jgi:hypothetical protein
LGAGFGWDYPGYAYEPDYYYYGGYPDYSYWDWAQPPWGFPGAGST